MIKSVSKCLMPPYEVLSAWCSCQKVQAAISSQKPGGVALPAEVSGDGGNINGGVQYL